MEVHVEGSLIVHQNKARMYVRTENEIKTWRQNLQDVFRQHSRSVELDKGELEVA